MRIKYFLLLIPMLLMTGCGNNSVKESKNLNSEAEAEWNKEMDIMLTKLDDKKMELICSQEMIPSEFASECYFKGLKKCQSDSGSIVNKSDLEKCLPVFIKELLENVGDE